MGGTAHRKPGRCAIRASSETGVAMAALYGISQGKVSAIRRHMCWRELAGNPFTGLGARA